MTPGTRVVLISDPKKTGVVRAKKWHDFSAEYLVKWDDESQPLEWHTSKSIARIPVSHNRRKRRNRDV